ncbi:aspartate kinase [Acetoanaerobium pronyense]|uniref:Aspartokinase n=1 Tax=Acetoanaerobium pronyense TaxID=1482736 RepID=A0ABS4KLW9_9FIRM|nr:aspartate kinase [Acetoanaerobium pronyense]
MKIIVQKYGGTSVENIEKIKKVAKKVIAKKEEGFQMVVVVSAMGKTTDALIDLSKEISSNPSKRDLDMLLSTGEQVSISLLSMAFQEYGYESISLTGFQAGIKTKGPYNKNKISDIDINKIKDNLEKGKIVVVAGFQGINEEGDITTLGRGGSDTTAVALSAKLNSLCCIYTDVEGIYSVDPRIYKDAKKLASISYEEMMEMASLGAGVMETRAVEIGCKYKVPIYVASSSKDIGGTYIKERDKSMEEKVITGLSISSDILMVTVNNLVFNSDNIATLFEKVAKENINVDMISQTSPMDEKVNVSFTTSKDELNALNKVMKEIKDENNEIEVVIEENISKISVVGIGMMNQSGVTAQVFRILADNNIEFKQVTTSEISISYTVASSDREKAVQILAKELNL